VTQGDVHAKPVDIWAMGDHSTRSALYGGVTDYPLLRNLRCDAVLHAPRKPTIRG
jgi:hypothetical protein